MFDFCSKSSIDHTLSPITSWLKSKVILSPYFPLPPRYHIIPLSRLIIPLSLLMNSPILFVSMKPSVIDNHNPHCFSFLWIFKARGNAGSWERAGRKKPWFEVFANSFTTADFKLPTWHHRWGWNWEEMCTKPLRNGSRIPQNWKPVL